MSKKYYKNFQFNMEEDECDSTYRSKKEKRQRILTKTKRKLEKRRENNNY